MLPPRIARAVPAKSAVKAESRKLREATDHVELVKLLPCCATGRPGPNDAHHLMTGVVRGTGMKAAGRYVIPLRRSIHEEAQTAKDCSPEEYLLREYGVLARELADALWAASPDIKAMQRVVLRHFWEARIRRGDQIYA